MADADSHIKLAYSSIPIFANDGTIDMGELNYLIGIAMADNEITEEEKRVLTNIFDRVPKENTSPRVLERIAEIRKRYSF